MVKKENPFVKFLRIILIIVLSPVLLIYFVCMKIKHIKNRKNRENFIKICTISQINALSGLEFEEFLKILFKAMGYEVSLTKRSKDYGADLVIVKSKHKYIVQAKCYSHTVGIKAVQEIISARAHYHIFGAMVVTNCDFSNEAQILAKENNIHLINGSILQALVQRFDVQVPLKSKPARTLLPSEVLEINERYRFWI